MTHTVHYWPTSFREAWCARYRIQQDRYARHFVRKCLRRRAFWLVPFLRVFRPGYFILDLEAASQIGAARSWEELETELEAFASNCRLRGGLLRNWLGIRLSGQRVIRFAQRLFDDAKPAARPLSEAPADQ